VLNCFLSLTVKLISGIVDGELNDLLLDNVYGCLYLKKIYRLKKINTTLLEMKFV